MHCNTTIKTNWSAVFIVLLSLNLIYAVSCKCAVPLMQTKNIYQNQKSFIQTKLHRIEYCKEECTEVSWIFLLYKLNEGHIGVLGCAYV